MAEHALTRHRGMAYLREKGARFAKASLHGGEVMLGAALAGIIQGLHERKEGEHGGAKVAGIPADLLIGGVATIGAAFEVIGDEMSSHLGHLGLGFLAGFMNDAGFHIGERKKVSGHWSLTEHDKGKKALPAGQPKAAGAFDPQAMAESLLRARRQAA